MPDLKAIVIDPLARTVRQIRVNPTLANLQAIVGGSIQPIWPVALGGDVLYCDEKGKVRLFDEEAENRGAFKLRTWDHDPLLGTCIILGDANARGNDTETQWTAEEVEEFVTWL